MSRPLLAMPMCAVLLLPGCGGDGSHAGKSGSNRQPVTAADFAREDLAVAHWEPVPAAPPVQAEPPAEAEAGVFTLTAAPGEPSSLSGAPTLTEDRVTVDSLIGHINGKPVFASRVLDEIGARLAAKVGEINNDTRWKDFAKQEIYEHLDKMVRDELILAEARQALTPDQKQGLLYVMDVLRSDIVSEQGGSRQKAEERMLSESGQNLDRAAKEALDLELFNKQIKEKVNARANVSWRDVEIEYERNFDKYNPSALAVLRMIWVPAEDVEGVKDMTARVAAGESFATLAALPINRYNNGEAGLSKTAFRGEFADPENKYFQPAELDTAVRTLTPGATTAPIQYRTFIAWIHFEKIEQPRRYSLYDVQLEIFRQLRKRRIDAEANRYLATLTRSGSYTDLRSMTERLLQIAIERFLIAER